METKEPIEPAAIAFHVLKDLSTFKHFTYSLIDGAIKSHAHKNRLTLSPAEYENIRNLVIQGAKNLCKLETWTYQGNNL